MISRIVDKDASILQRIGEWQREKCQDFSDSRLRCRWVAATREISRMWLCRTSRLQRRLKICAESIWWVRSKRNGRDIWYQCSDIRPRLMSQECTSPIGIGWVASKRTRNMSRYVGQSIESVPANRLSWVPARAREKEKSIRMCLVSSACCLW